MILIHTVTLETNEDITMETEIKQSGETGTKEKITECQNTCPHDLNINVTLLPPPRRCVLAP